MGSIVFATWAIPILVFFTTILGWQYFTNERTVPRGKCYVQYLEAALFNCLLQIGYFWITLTAMIGLYIAIYRVASDLHRRSEEKRNQNMACLVSMAGKTVTNIGSVLTMSYKPNESLPNEKPPENLNPENGTAVQNAVEVAKDEPQKRQKLSNAMLPIVFETDAKASEVENIPTRDNTSKDHTSIQSENPTIVVHNVSSEGIANVQEMDVSRHNSIIADEHLLNTNDILIRPCSVHEKLNEKSGKDWARRNHSFDECCKPPSLKNNFLWESTFKIQNYQKQPKRSFDASFVDVEIEKIFDHSELKPSEYSQDIKEIHTNSPPHDVQKDLPEITEELKGECDAKDKSDIKTPPSAQAQKQLFNFNLIFFPNISSTKAASIFEPFKSRLATAISRFSVASIITPSPSELKTSNQTINQSTNHSINHSTSQSNNQSTNPLNNQTNLVQQPEATEKYEGTSYVPSEHNWITSFVQHLNGKDRSSFSFPKSPAFVGRLFGNVGRSQSFVITNQFNSEHIQMEGKEEEISKTEIEQNKTQQIGCFN